MLTREEESFIEWWQANRDREKKVRNRWFIGLPAGIMLALPVLLSVFAQWNKQVEIVTSGQMIVVLLAVLGIITFIAVFSVQHKWEMREQIYKELIQKKNKAADTGNRNEAVKV